MTRAAASRSAETRLDAVLDAWVGFVGRHPRRVVLGVLAGTILAFGWAATHLGVNSDNLRMLGEESPVRQRHDAFARVFPNLSEALLVVVDGPTPTATRRAAEALEQKLAARDASFRDVFRPGSGPFFERNGLLYRSTEELDTLGDRLAAAQPFLIALEREPTLATLSSLVTAGLSEPTMVAADPALWTALFDRISHATREVHEDRPVAVSWRDLLLGDAAPGAKTRELLIVEPILDFESVLPAAEPLAAIRAAAAELGTPEISVRITGNPALNHEEMLALVWDVGVLGLISFALIAAILWLALRSYRLVVAALATLLAGLVWTAAIASVTVGHLNLVSLTFGVLYIGLGIDSAIHLLMHYAEERRGGLANDAALRGAARLVGSSLVLCAVTTSLGFFAFLFTDYLGVAELGLIAGSGMLMILFHTLTFLPALLSSWLAPSEGPSIPGEPRSPLPWAARIERHPAAVRRVAAAAALASLFALPALRFDPNVVALRNPETESVRAFRELVDEGGAMTPWYADVLASDSAQAERLAARLRGTPGVERTVTLESYIPDEQPVKRAILADIALFVAPVRPPSGDASATADSSQVQLEALRALRDALTAEWLVRDATPLGESARLLRNNLEELLGRGAREDTDLGPELARLATLLLGRFPQEVQRLRTALEPAAVTAEDLPPEIRRRMLAPDGRARVQVFPSEDLGDAGALNRFADAVQSVAPDATGMAIDVVGFARVISRSLVEALTIASVLIALVVLAFWRRPADVALALTPLLVAGLLTAAAMVLLGIRFNFANVIVLPLLLGIGVDSGIHMVHRARAGLGAGRIPSELTWLGTTTARAVFFGFVTTMVSFGTLALSDHRGVASLGLLLALGMSLMMICNLVVLPALLELRFRRPGAAQAVRGKDAGAPGLPAYGGGPIYEASGLHQRGSSDMPGLGSSPPWRREGAGSRGPAASRRFLSRSLSRSRSR